MTIIKPVAGAFAVAVGVAAALVTATPAQAASPSWAYVSGTVLNIQAALGATNTIYLNAGATDFNVHDATTAVQLDGARTGGCVRSNSNMIVCPNSVTEVIVHLSDQNDFLQNDTDRRVVVFGDAGNDAVKGGSTGDWMQGGPGQDRLEGRGGNDDLYGGDGDDLSWGGDGNDWMEGEAGRDETHGETGDDWLFSADGRDTLMGSHGNDHLEDSALVDGGWHDDTLVVSNHHNGDFYGGAGFDIIDYSLWRFAVHASLDGNSNDGDSSNSCDDFIGCPVPFVVQNVHGDFERVIGTNYGDKISGNGEPDQIYGGGGDDKLYGNGGDDVLDAEVGVRQTTDGGSGHDSCRGLGTLAKISCELP